MTVPAVVADEAVEVRRELHRRPELSWQEHATTALIRSRLTALGLDPLPVPTPTGAAAVLDTGRPGPTVLLRADIDALPVRERTGLAWASTVDGVMHACGHDGHTAALLAAGALLTADPVPAGRVVLLFQPAEELGEGARALLDGGFLGGLGPVAAAVGIHLTSMAPPGLVGLRAGTAWAGVDVVRLTVAGAGGHAAMPGAGGPLLAAAALAGRLSTAVAGLACEGTAAVCTPSTLHVGEAPNVVSETAVVEASLRTFDPEQRATALAAVDALTAALDAEFGTTTTRTAGESVPPVVNDATVVSRLVGALGVVLPSGTVIPAGGPITPSDDMAWFLGAVPGAHLVVGAAPGGRYPAHHSSTFDIDEGALSTAATVYATAARALTDL